MRQASERLKNYNNFLLSEKLKEKGLFSA